MLGTPASSSHGDVPSGRQATVSGKGSSCFSKEAGRSEGKRPSRSMIQLSAAEGQGHPRLAQQLNTGGPAHRGKMIIETAGAPRPFGPVDSPRRPPGRDARPPTLLRRRGRAERSRYADIHAPKN